jgi:hypothetical protein
MQDLGAPLWNDLYTMEERWKREDQTTRGRTVPEKQVFIAKQRKVVDELKTEMMERLAGVFRGLHEADDEVVSEQMAAMLLLHYVLARRLGIPFHRLEEKMLQQIRIHKRMEHPLEADFQDWSVLEEYMLSRRSGE